MTQHHIEPSSPRRPRILHVITGLGRGGAETVLSRLVTATQADFEHAVIALRGDDHYGPILRSHGVNVRALNIGRGRYTTAGIIDLVRIIRHERPSIVQTWMYHANLLGGVTARLAGVRPVLWAIRNMNLSAAAISPSTRFIAWLGAQLSGAVPDAIICNSTESARVHAVFGYSRSLLSVIPNGYDVTRFQPDPAVRAATREQFGIAPEHLLIGMVARWDPQKDHANLLHAFRIVAQRDPSVRALLVGDGMEPANQALSALMRATGVEGKVILAGGRDDVPAIMNALDLHVLSSLGEAFPNALAEAMACGTPCVTTAVGDAAFIVGTTGWVVAPRDSEALAAAVLQAIARLRLEGREALSALARARIVENFALSRMTNAYAALWCKFAGHTV